MKKVLTYGTFDLFHRGHENIIKTARSFGDYIIVGLSTDEFNSQKEKKAHDSYETRKSNLLKTGMVDEVIPEYTWDQKREDILNNKIDIFIMGSDWKGKFDDLNDICEVIYPERTPGISSTMLREALNKNKTKK